MSSKSTTTIPFFFPPPFFALHSQPCDYFFGNLRGASNTRWGRYAATECCWHFSLLRCIAPHLCRLLSDAASPPLRQNRMSRGVARGASKKEHLLDLPSTSSPPLHLLSPSTPLLPCRLKEELHCHHITAAATTIATTATTSSALVHAVADTT